MLRYISKKIRREILERDNFTCVYCGARAYEEKLGIDHVIPFKMGGSNNINNLVTCCRKCNSEKGLEKAAWFWRRKNRGKRNVDMALLKQIASILGTSVAYLMGETDNSEVVYTAENVTASSDEVTKQSDTSKETIHQETPGHLIFKHGDYCVDVPDTPSNQAWFRELTMNLLMAGIATS